MVTLAQSALESDVRRLARLMLDAIRDDMPPEAYAQGLALGEALTVDVVYTTIRAELLPPT